MNRTARKRVPGVTSTEPLPSLNRDLNVPRTNPESSRESLVVAATPKMSGADTLNTAAIVTGAVVAAPVAISLAAGVATAVGTHKVMDKMSDAVAPSITEWIVSLGALNPFKKIWNRIVGEGGGHGHGGGHDDHHGGGHGHDHGHGHH